MNSFSKSLASGIAWKFLYYISAFLLNLAIAHSWGAANSGQFYYFLNNLSFVVLFAGLGIESATGFFNARKEIPPGNLFTLGLSWSCIATASILLLVMLRIPGFFLADTRSSLLPAAFAGCSLLINITSAICYSAGDNRMPNLIPTLLNIILIILLPANPLISNKISQAEYLNVYLAVSASAALIFTAVMFRRKVYIRFTLSLQGKEKAFTRYALLSFVSAVLFALLQRCDYWIVSYFSNACELGNYLQASRFTQMITLLPGLASFTLFPLTAAALQQQERTDTEEKLIKLSGIYFYTGLLLCACIALAGKWLFPFLYGHTFDKMFVTFLLLIPGILAFATSYALAPYFAGKNLIAVDITAKIVAIVLMVVADFLLIPRFSVYGAAVGCSAAYCLYLAILLFNFGKYYSFSFAKVFHPIATFRILIKQQNNFRKRHK